MQWDASADLGFRAPTALLRATAGDSTHGNSTPTILNMTLPTTQARCIPVSRPRCVFFFLTALQLLAQYVKKVDHHMVHYGWLGNSEIAIGHAHQVRLFFFWFPPPKPNRSFPQLVVTHPEHFRATRSVIQTLQQGADPVRAQAAEAV